MAYWLFKSEPQAFSIDDLKACSNSTDHWDGIRNYQVRNMLRDQIKKGDEVFFYHSSCKEPGIVGIARVVKNGYPDFTAWDPESKYFDPKSSPDNPRWYMVDVKFVRKFKKVITLQELKLHRALEDMQLLRKGNRLSILPIEKKQWDYILDSLT